MLATLPRIGCCGMASMVVLYVGSLLPGNRDLHPLTDFGIGQDTCFGY